MIGYLIRSLIPFGTVVMRAKQTTQIIQNLAFDTTYSVVGNLKLSNIRFVDKFSMASEHRLNFVIRYSRFQYPGDERAGI